MCFPSLFSFLSFLVCSFLLFSFFWFFLFLRLLGEAGDLIPLAAHLSTLSPLGVPELRLQGRQPHAQRVGKRREKSKCFILLFQTRCQSVSVVFLFLLLFFLLPSLPTKAQTRMLQVQLVVELSRLSCRVVSGSGASGLCSIR